VFPLNLAQIRSAVPEIFDAQTKNETRPKDVLPNIHCTQAAESSRHPALSTPRHPWLPPNGPVFCCSSFAAYGARVTMHCQWDDAAVFPVLSLTFDLDIQTHPNEGPIWHASVAEISDA